MYKNIFVIILTIIILLTVLFCSCRNNINKVVNETFIGKSCDQYTEPLYLETFKEHKKLGYNNFKERNNLYVDNGVKQLWKINNNSGCYYSIQTNNTDGKHPNYFLAVEEGKAFASILKDGTNRTWEVIKMNPMEIIRKNWDSSITQPITRIISLLRLPYKQNALLIQNMSSELEKHKDASNIGDFVEKIHNYQFPADIKIGASDQLLFKEMIATQIDSENNNIIQLRSLAPYTDCFNKRDCNKRDNYLAARESGYFGNGGLLYMSNLPNSSDTFWRIVDTETTIYNRKIGSYNKKFVKSSGNVEYLIMDGLKYKMPNSNLCMNASNIFTPITDDLLNQIPDGEDDASYLSKDKVISEFCRSNIIAQYIEKYNYKFIRDSESFATYLIINDHKYWIKAPNNCYQGDLASGVEIVNKNILDLFITGDGNASIDSKNIDVKQYCMQKTKDKLNEYEGKIVNSNKTANGINIGWMFLIKNGKRYSLYNPGDCSPNDNNPILLDPEIISMFPKGNGLASILSTNNDVAQYCQKLSNNPAYNVTVDYKKDCGIGDWNGAGYPKNTSLQGCIEACNSVTNPPCTHAIYQPYSDSTFVGNCWIKSGAVTGVVTDIRRACIITNAYDKYDGKFLKYGDDIYLIKNGIKHKLQYGDTCFTNDYKTAITITDPKILDMYTSSTSYASYNSTNTDVAKYCRSQMNKTGCLDSVCNYNHDCGTVGNTGTNWASFKNITLGECNEKMKTYANNTHAVYDPKYAACWLKGGSDAVVADPLNRKVCIVKNVTKCPTSNPYAYNGDLIKGGYCCTIPPNTTPGYPTGTLDHCNGIDIKCSNPPCVDNVTKCPTSNPYAYNGDLIKGGYCCTIPPNTTPGYPTGTLDHCNGIDIKCSNPPCVDNGTKCPTSNPYAYNGDNIKGGYCCTVPPNTTPGRPAGTLDHCNGTFVKCSNPPCIDNVSNTKKK
jgi:hypothetical protein